MIRQEKRYIDFDRLLWLAMEKDDNHEEYCLECAKYRKQHGYVAFIDIRNGLREEVVNIHYAFERYNNSRYVVSACCDVIGFDSECLDRFYSVVRAVRRWYRVTKWERCLSWDIVQRLEQYVYGKNTG